MITAGEKVVSGVQFRGWPAKGLELQGAAGRQSAAVFKCRAEARLTGRQPPGRKPPTAANDAEN